MPLSLEQAELARKLWGRVAAARPRRLCDDEQGWAAGWRELLEWRRDWLEYGDVAADEVCIDPSDFDGGFGPGSYFAHAMEKDD